jgi:hypothetical protein
VDNKFSSPAADGHSDIQGKIFKPKGYIFALSLVYARIYALF